MISWHFIFSSLRKLCGLLFERTGLAGGRWCEEVGGWVPAPVHLLRYECQHLWNTDKDYLLDPGMQGWNARLERPYSMKVPFKCTKHPWCPCINILVVRGPLEKHLRARKTRHFLHKPNMTSLLWETQTRNLRKTASKLALLALYVFPLFPLDLLGFWR